MKKEEFIDALKSNRASEIRKALTSRHRIKSKEEVAALCETVLIRNQNFQEHALQLALRANKKIVGPLLRKLVLIGIESGIRTSALNRLLEAKAPESLETLLVSAVDEDIEIQEKALQNLNGLMDPRVTTLLIDRTQNPEAALSGDETESAEDIRQSAIQALATKGLTQAVRPLVKLMLQDDSHWPQIGKTLGAIGGTEVVEVLLDVTEGTWGHIAELNEDFELEAVAIIKGMDLKSFPKEHLNRYRKLLKKVYPAALEQLPQRKYVLEETVRRLDTHLLDMCINALQEAANPSVAPAIIDAMQEGNLKKAMVFWLNVFEEWEPSYQNKAETAFGSVAQRCPNQVIPFLQQAE